MPISPCFLPDVQGALQVGQDRFQIGDDGRNALGLRSHAQEALFEVEIERQGACQLKRELGVFKIEFRAAFSRQGHDFAVQFSRLSGLCGSGVLRFLIEEHDFGAQEWHFLVDFHYLEAAAAFGKDIHAAVRIFLRDRDDFGGAADLRDPFIMRAHDAEHFLFCQAISDHLLVARFEDVKRLGHAGQQHQFERKQREKNGQEPSSGSSPGKNCRAGVVSIVRQGLTWQRAAAYKHGMELSGKVVVVTGASMGIGEAIARLFASHGASVVLLSRDAGRVEAARVRLGHPDRTLALSCDVRHREEVDRALGLILHHFHGVDVWINNAGHGLMDSVATMDMAACHDLFETNFFGTVAAMQAVTPIMKQQGGGTIINISSVAGHIPLPFNAAYSATKFAMNAIGKAAGVEMKRDNIHVLTVCPGYVRTNFRDNIVRGREQKTVRPASTRGITAERVARATFEGYRKRKREVIVPWAMHIPVKIYQLFPWLVEWAMSRMGREA
jgi:short-subunit dehydrogenase